MAAEMPPENAEELYEDAPCGYVSCSVSAGTIIQVNRTFERWSGFSREQLVGTRRFRDLLSGAGRILYETRHLPMLALGGMTSTMLLEMLRADGSRIPILANSAIRTDAAGRPSLVRTTILDATERQQYERQLIDARNRAEHAEAAARQALGVARAADLAKARFLAAINHEFRTPIGIVLGFSELLLEAANSGQPNPRQAEYLADVVAAAKHILSLVEDSTRYAELTRFEMRLQRDSTTARSLVNKALGIVSNVLTDAGITVNLPNDSEDLTVQADPALMAEAVSCVLREIARHAPKGTSVDIGWRPGPKIVVFELNCAALALPTGALLKPLDAGDIYSRGMEGVGLGISVAERIVRLHGGRVRASQSAACGIGITMTVPQPGTGNDVG